MFCFKILRYSTLMKSFMAPECRYFIETYEFDESLDTGKFSGFIPLTACAPKHTFYVYISFLAKLILYPNLKYRTHIITTFQLRNLQQHSPTVSLIATHFSDQLNM
jgi:hypothetical protein